jgi:multicomponent Na+:H+ antiporter subunit B
MKLIMRYVGLASVFLTGFLLMYAVLDFPDWGDPNSPASTHLSTHFIEETYKETHVPNMVTAVLADYRAMDTLLETAVIFVAGIAIIAVLRRGESPRLPSHRPAPAYARTRKNGHEEKDLIIRMTSRLLVPPIQLFALYVIAHGHYSPGGGFQGGVILTASLILIALSFNLRGALQNFSERRALIFANVGVLIFAGAGLTTRILGQNFLEYGVLEEIYPGTDAVMAHSHSMLVVEVGVGFTVMSILFLIFANLSSKGTMRKGL